MYCSHCGAPLAHLAPVQCAACSTRHWRNAKPGGGGLVTHENKLMLVRRSKAPWLGFWDIPGGFCDETEHPAKTAEREILEETGLHVRAVRFLGIWLDTYGGDNPDPQPEVTMNIFYLCELQDPPESAHTTDEVNEIGWFSPNNLPEDLAFPNHARHVVAAWRQAFLQGEPMSHLPDLQ
jgi:8-oxo-dGTP diphosphatase